VTNVETRYGSLAVPELKDDVIGRFLARYGEWAWDEARFVASILPDQDARVLDIGAFVGTFGLGLSRTLDLGFLCAVEANEEVAPLLKENLDLNGPVQSAVLEGVVAWPGAVVGPGRSVQGNAGSLSFAEVTGPARDQAAPNVPSRVLTLPDLRKEYGPFDLVKLDVEGMELGVLRSDSEFLSLGQTSIWAECNEDPHSLAVAELLLSWGLDLYYFAFPSYNPDNLRGDPEPIFPFAYEAGLLAAPKTVPKLDEEFKEHRCILKRIDSLEDVKDALWRTPRWGYRDWIGLGREELVSLAVHRLRGETLDDYLDPGWAAGELQTDHLSALRLQVKALTSAIADLEKGLRFQHLRADSAEKQQARASAQALARLSEVSAERERRMSAEARADTAEATARAAEAAVRAAKSATIAAESAALAAEARVQDIETSSTWRLTAPVRRLIGSTPRLRTTLRRGLSAAARTLRYLRGYWRSQNSTASGRQP